MKLIIGTLALILSASFLSPMVADACGYPKKHQPPQCQPTPTPVPTTPPTSTPVPPPLPTPQPPPPTATSVASVQPPIATATRIVSAQPSAASAPYNASNPPAGEYCVWEPTTGQFEIRRGDAERFIRQGAERPLAPHVCDQHQPVATPTSIVVVEVVELVEATPVEVTVEVQTVPEVVEEEIPSIPPSEEEWTPPTDDNEAPVQVPEVASVSWD